MKVIDAIGAAFAALIGIAALSLVVAPNSNMANVVKALGDATTSLITAAKAYPNNPK